MESQLITESISDVAIKVPKKYKVIMHNDDFTTFEFVVYVLTNIFNKSEEEAEKVTIDVHQKGIGIAGIYTYDIALTKKAKATKLAQDEGFPFKLTVEEE